MPRRDRLLALAMPGLLLLIGVVHQVRVRTLDQSSWHGTGFGMFATYDSAQTRAVRAWTMPGREPLAVDESTVVEEARIVPTEANARAAAQRIAADAGLPAGSRVLIEIRGVEVERSGSTLFVTTVSLAEVEVEVEPES